MQYLDTISSKVLAELDKRCKQKRGYLLASWWQSLLASKN